MKAVIKFRQKSFILFKMFQPSNASHLSSEQDAEVERRLDHSDHVKVITKFIPKLTENLHKGQCGRIGIIGGSAEYTGAPYFAAISSLKLGADLAYVFCCKDAGPVIKSYSPELIVHPIMDSVDAVKRFEPWLGRLHVLVIGPGMGRDPGLHKNVRDIIAHCKEKMNPCIPLVIDAEGLVLVAENLDLIKGYNGPLFLTPNAVEYSRLNNVISQSSPLKMAAALNAVIVQKGVKDVIVNGIQYDEFKFTPELLMLTCDVPGSSRRCGGQGDILAGCIATFAAWLEIYFRHNTHFDFNYKEATESRLQKLSSYTNSYMKYSLAAYAACMVTRTSSKLAFEKKGRGMTASDMIDFIPSAFKSHFEH